MYILPSNLKNELLQTLNELTNEKYKSRKWIRYNPLGDEAEDQRIVNFFTYSKGMLNNHTKLNIPIDLYKLLGTLWGIIDLFSKKNSDLSKKKMIDKDEWTLFKKISEKTIKRLKQTSIKDQ